MNLKKLPRIKYTKPRGSENERGSESGKIYVCLIRVPVGDKD